MNKPSDIENDVQLVLMVKAGDESAFGKFYYLHQNRVRAMWLRYIKELSYREIVWEMQALLGTVKIWLFRGRHQLKRALEKQQVGGWAG